jgi:hypothetical protein
VVTIERAAVAGLLLLGGQRRRAGDVGLHPCRRLALGHQLLHGAHRLVGQRLALVAREIDLEVGGFAVRALGACRGQRVAPEVLDMLDVFGVGFQRADQVRVVAAGVVVEGLLPLQHDHHRAVGLVLLEHLADVFHRDDRGRVVGAHRHRPLLADLFELRHRDVQERGERDPDEDDRDRGGTDEPGDAVEVRTGSILFAQAAHRA